MKKVIIFGCLVLAVLYVAGCGNSGGRNSVVGTYMGSKGTEIVIGSNGYLKWVLPPQGLAGSTQPATPTSFSLPYKVKDGTLSTPSTSSYFVSVFKIQGNKLIPLDEYNRVRKRAGVWTKE